MACCQEVTCPACGSNNILKSGRSARGIQRYRCLQHDCSTKTFMQEYCYKAYEPGIKEKIVDMAINSSGIRNIARVLNINKNTVIRTLKNIGFHRPGKPLISYFEHGNPLGSQVRTCL
jgi:transposase-like protein